VRANEIVTSLLNPLIENNLLTKVFIKTPGVNENKALSQDKETAGFFSILPFNPKN
jgi:hypothetical protein